MPGPTSNFYNVATNDTSNMGKAIAMMQSRRNFDMDNEAEDRAISRLQSSDSGRYSAPPQPKGFASGGSVIGSEEACRNSGGIWANGACIYRNIEQDQRDIFAARDPEYKAMLDKYNDDKYKVDLAAAKAELSSKGVQSPKLAAPAPAGIANGKAPAPYDSPVPVAAPPAANNPVSTVNPPPQDNKYRPTGSLPKFANGGTVPVRVSNGEFEFTPEQVTNIGAAILASMAGGCAGSAPQQKQPMMQPRGFTPGQNLR